MEGFYFITDHGLSCNGNFGDVEQALQAGVRVVQYREKSRLVSEYFDELLAIRGLCRRFRALCIINDSLDLACRIDADGVHLGQEDAPIEQAKQRLRNKIVGVSAGNLEQAKNAERQGAQYIGVGAVFPTQTKQKQNQSLGLHNLEVITQSVRCPVVAIGGITLDTAEAVLKTGVDMIAAISASLQNGRVYEQVKAFQELFTHRAPS